MAGVAGNAVKARSTVATGKRGAVVVVHFALLARETNGAEALEAIDEVTADSPIEARVWETLVHVDFAVNTGVAWHANASESSAFVEASAFVLAGTGVALVDVEFTPGSREATRAVAAEGSRRVDAVPSVFAGVSLGTFVHIIGAVHPFKSVGAGAEIGAIDGTSVADGSDVARVAGARVV